MRTSSKAATFYDTVLATIGAKRLMEFGEFIGYGVDKPTSGSVQSSRGEPNRELHIAFVHPTAPPCGSSSTPRSGPAQTFSTSPREWPEYHPGYSGAFVRDPDGNNVEAVCHRPE